MNAVLRNLFLVATLVAVAVILLRAAKQSEGPTVPAAAIQGGDPKNDASEEQELTPRVLQVAPEEAGSLSPVAPLEGPSYPPGPGSRAISPVPETVSFPAAGENAAPTFGTPTPAVGGDFQLPADIQPQPTPAADAESLLAAEVEEANVETPEAVESLKPIEMSPSQQTTSRIVTGPEDSFWSISQEAYGSGDYYRALFRHNRSAVLRPDQLKAGIEIEIPPLETLRAQYPQEFTDE